MESPVAAGPRPTPEGLLDAAPIPPKAPHAPQTSETFNASSDFPSPHQPTSTSAAQAPLPLAAPPFSPIETKVVGFQGPASSRNTRSQSTSVGSNPIRRKPLSAKASPLVARYSSGEHLTTLAVRPNHGSRFSRAFSLDSPTLYEFPGNESSTSLATLTPLPPRSSPIPEVQEGSRVSSPVSQDSPRSASEDEFHPRDIPADSNPADSQTSSTADAPAYYGLLSSHGDSDTDSDSDVTADSSAQRIPSTRISKSNGNMSLGRKPGPPHLDLGQLAPYDPSAQPSTPLAVDKERLNKPLPKSPGSVLGTFFSWGSPSPSATEFSDKTYSPLPSPFSLRRAASADESSATTDETTSSKTNAAGANPLGYRESYQHTPLADTSSTSDQIEEMEDELRAISAELASSIRREMDLEDLVDKLQTEINNPPGKRTSDYFSDSGLSSAKFSEYDQNREEVAQVQRRGEQEKAQVRLELTNKLQEERSKRKELDQQIKELAEKASQVELAQVANQDNSGRLRELEKTCEDLRRRLAEERQAKGNFEDLLSALKGELQNAANERDNLRDEIVPQLRARVEGLEADAVESARMTYETTKIQQELEWLKEENSELKSQRADKPTPLNLKRSNSVTASTLKAQRSSGGLSRSNTTKQVESREVLSERLKDVEAQRDALHNALKNLLDRQEFQNRENDKKIKILEMERDRLLSTSPMKAGYERELSNLRQEINVLRRRTEDAMDQKWQVEKGLGGLKMDLDRAEGEIASLRDLLQENDILIPEGLARASSSSSGSGSFLAAPVTSASLQKAYNELQDAYAEVLERVKKLELTPGVAGPQDEKTQLAMQRLEHSLSGALSDRDMARDEANALRSQLESQHASEASHLSQEQELADQLRESADRIEELAAQVKKQLGANSLLRTRLSETVTQRDAEQAANKRMITGLQSRLKTLEEQVMAAQTASEERVTRHEEEMATLRETHSTQLNRLRDSSGLRSPRLFPPKSPLSPMLATGPRSPRLSAMRPSSSSARSDPGSSEEALAQSQIEALKAKVGALEQALAMADAEMQEVVGRMNAAQIEVMNLQEEREAAVRETRKLQRMLEQEKVKVFEDRFKAITG